ncbi:MAG TPA: ABC transporter permease [Gemmatimonadales bacterium]
MPFLEAVRLALATIRVQKLKSFFTLLGVTIGVMFLIAVVSIVEGMGHYMEHEFIGKLMGVNTFELRRRPNMVVGNVTREEWMSWSRRPRIQVSDIEPVVSQLPAGTRWAHESSNQVSVQSRYASPKELQASAVDGDYFTIRKLDIETGRLFSPQEMQLGASVVVIGPEVATRYFPNLDPLGQEIRLGGQPYTVVGVTKSQGKIFGFSLDQFVVAPYRSPLRRHVNPPGVVDAVIIQSPTSEQMLESMEEVRGIMRGRHKLRPSQKDDFALETSEGALTFFEGIKQKLVLAGVALPAFGLVVGAIVIMNIMLVAVAERTREIGIRKALGARRRDIMAQFLVEAATLSTVGAALGIALGIALSQGIAAATPLPASVAPWSLVVATLLGAGVGIAAGMYPASRASRLDPIAALRQE